MHHVAIALLALTSYVCGETIPVDENGRVAENLLLIRSSASDKWKK